MKQYTVVKLVWFAVSVVSVIGQECTDECAHPTLTCHDGSLRGKILKSREGRDIFSFLGIPFAKPPTEDLRFKAPVPYGSWNGTMNATKVHAICPQRDIYRRSEIFEGEEDCLYLNVYTPQRPSSSKAVSLPVMVFFHGGGWLCGGGNALWYGPDVLLDRDIVLVVTNYRLGALGFLSTGDAVVPGNNGLKDQNVALKWIQRNINAFGGNPDSVTIFGESAGGASVHYHMVSPLSKGLFHRVIALSGTSLCVWASAPGNENVENSKKLAQSLGCPTFDSEKMVDCLRQSDPMEIIKKDTVFMEWDFDPMIPFKPTIEPDIEGAFLVEHPVDIVKAGKSAPVPLIVGITSEDGALRGAGILNNNHLLEEINTYFEKLVPVSLMYGKTAKNISKATREIRKFYFDDGKIDWSKKNDLINMYTDGWFLNCADKTVQLHRNYTNYPVYYYLFNHRGSASFTEIFGGGDEDYGVCHADDLQYLFPVGVGLFPEKKQTESDVQVSKLFTSLFANFAYTGNPTPKLTTIIPEKWHPVESEQIEYYHIDARSPGMRKGLFFDRTNFWRNLEWHLWDHSPSFIRDEL